MNGAIFRVGRHEPKAFTPGFPAGRVLQRNPLQSKFPVQEAYGHIPVGRLQRLVYDKDVAFINSGINHGIPHYPSIESSLGVADKLDIEIDAGIHIVLSRRGKTGVDGLQSHFHLYLGIAVFHLIHRVQS